MVISLGRSGDRRSTTAGSDGEVRESILKIEICRQARAFSPAPKNPLKSLPANAKHMRLEDKE